MDLELTCPSCEQVLVLDAGFAGGVCRCSSCGTLMSVPHIAPSDSASSPKRRPDTPEQPGSPTIAPEPTNTPARDSASAATPTRRSSRTTTRHPGQDLATSQNKPTAKTARAKVQATTLRLNRRFAIRAGIISAFILISSMAVFSVSLLYQYKMSESDKKQQPHLVLEFEYDPEANPYQLDKPNFLGLQLSPKTVIVIDTPATSSRWLGLVKEAIITGSDFNTTDLAIQLVFTNPDQPTVFPDDITPLSELRPNELRKYLNSSLAMGNTDPVNAIRLALVTEPAQLIFVIGQNLSPQHVRALRTMMQARSQTIFDCFLIGIRDNNLKRLTAENNGQTITLTAQQLSHLRYEMP